MFPALKKRINLFVVQLKIKLILHPVKVFNSVIKKSIMAIENCFSYLHLNDDDSFEVKEKKYYKGIEEHPEFKGNYLHALYFVYWQHGQYEDALICIQQAIKHISSQDDFGEYYHCLAGAFMDLSKFPEALEAMKKSVEASRFPSERLYYLGDMYVKSGDYANAVETFVKLLSTPMHIVDWKSEDWFFECMAYYYTEDSGNLLEDEQKEENALDIYRKLLAAASTPAQQAYMHCVMCEFYLHQEDYEEAQNEADIAVELLPDDPITLETMELANNK